ncbi:PepSY-associated TM helix domain-containing protein [Shewanella youngdeokensis]|uniref:PepSY-associated TM helix domain-containing protein n=1 Tax=Shewanella youngdeokensis TaxID=2999068 RepID=A0ABZ0K238_9GAMM|nr:PepSY-associated TM helix domain-containing protein [Shewanella sp. DAU334]
MTIKDCTKKHIINARGPGVRKANSWLHTLTGLFFGWIFYLIFFTGTLSFYAEELKLWAWPEAHQASTTTTPNFKAVANYLTTHASGASEWFISLPDDRYPVTSLRYFEAGERPSKFGGKRLSINPQTGEPIAPRESRLVSKIVQSHFMLFGLPKGAGLAIVGIITMVMFIALITGVVIHRKIFSDFFTFRPKRGQLSWQDMHNVTGVVALPYHFVFIFSGLLLTVFLLNPWGVNSAMDGDKRSFRELSGGKHGLQMQYQPSPALQQLPVSQGMEATLTSIYKQLQVEAPNGLSAIMVRQPGTDKQSFLVRGQKESNLAHGANARTWQFDSQGKLTSSAIPKVPQSDIVAFNNILEQMHQQLHAGPIARAVYFLGGLLGCIMIATGLIMWVQKREKRKRNTQPHRGVVIAQHLNVVTIIGLPISILLAMWANHLLPQSMSGRAPLELAVWGVSWLVLIAHTAWVKPANAWRQHTKLLGVLALLLAVFNMSLLYPMLGLGNVLTWWQMPLIVQLIDVGLLIVALLSLLALRYIPAPAKRTQLKQQEAAKLKGEKQHA